jgi:hypothetical protein
LHGKTISFNLGTTLLVETLLVKPVDPFDDVAADFGVDHFDEGEPNIETTMPPWN